MIATASACGAQGMQVIGGHRFKVPEANLIPENSRPFFLPPSRTGEFAFFVNPQDPLPQRVLVGVDTKTNVCSRAAGTEAQVNATVCGPQPFEWKGKPLRRTGDSIFWAYELVDATNLPKGVLVSCFQSHGFSKGLCSAALPFGDLVLTVRLTDAQTDNLAAWYDRASLLLQEWEVK